VKGSVALPPIWVINLKRSADRRAFITAHLRDLGLSFELIEAADGEALSTEELAAVYQAALCTPRPLTPGEIGCALSHLRLYQRQMDEGHEAVVILEDDAIVDPSFLDTMAQLARLPIDWELLLLCRSDAQVSFWGRQALSDHHRCVRFASLAHATTGYLLRRSGAAKLLAHGYPILRPADCLTGGGCLTGVRLYGLDPPCVSALPLESMPTTMPEAHALHRRWPTKEELGDVLWALHKAKWGLIHLYRRMSPFSMI